MTTTTSGARLEHGLQLPNGEVHWGVYRGRPMGTEEERSKLALALHMTASEVGFAEETFVDLYKWRRRTVTEHSQVWSIDDPEVAPPLNQEQTVTNGAPVKAPSRRRTAK